MVTRRSFYCYDVIGRLSPMLSQGEEGVTFWIHALNRLHGGLEPHGVEILIQIPDQFVARCPGIWCFWSPDGGIFTGAIMRRFSGRDHHDDDEATLLCGVPVGATPDLRVIVGGVVIRGCSWCRGARCSSRWLEDVCPDRETLCCHGGAMVRPYIRIQTWAGPT
jgi:hypothetical protein